MADKATMMADTIDPEVLAEIVQYTLNEKISFVPLVDVDTTLQGQPGDTLTFPYWKYMGDATDITEGDEIDTDNIQADKKSVKIKAIGKGFAVTDWAVNSGYGDPYGEGARQLGLAMANKMDNDVLAALKQANLTVDVDPTVDGLTAATDIFNDEDDEPITLVASPKAVSMLRLDTQHNFIKGSEMGANALMTGIYGSIDGVQIVRSRKLKGGEAFLVKPHALKLLVKKDASVEVHRQPSRLRTQLFGNSFYAPYLYDDTKAIAVTFNNVPVVATPLRDQDQPITDDSEDDGSGTGTDNGTTPDTGDGTASN